MLQVVVIQKRLFALELPVLFVEFQKIFRKTFRNRARRQIVLKLLLPRKRIGQFGKNPFYLILDGGKRRNVVGELRCIVLFEPFLSRKGGAGLSAGGKIVGRGQKRSERRQQLLGVIGGFFSTDFLEISPFRFRARRIPRAFFL